MTVMEPQITILRQETTLQGGFQPESEKIIITVIIIIMIIRLTMIIIIMIIMIMHTIIMIIVTIRAMIIAITGPFGAGRDPIDRTM